MMNGQQLPARSGAKVNQGFIRPKLQNWRLSSCSSRESAIKNFLNTENVKEGVFVTVYGRRRQRGHAQMFFLTRRPAAAGMFPIFKASRALTACAHDAASSLA